MKDVATLRGDAARAPVERGFWRWLALALAIVVADRVTKDLVAGALAPGEVRPYTAFFSLVLAYNTGAAFSFLADAQGWQRGLFTAIAIVAGVILVWLLRRGGARLYLAGVALILGGAIGNLWDRLAIGRVVDFLLFHVDRYAWPAFNVADSAITIGAALLILDSLRARRAGHSR
jgi:signal peptidase II